MYKKVVIFISAIMCILLLCSCANRTSPQTETKNDVQDDNEVLELKVIRYPQLGSEQGNDYSDYYESGLLYPSQSRTVDSLREGTSQKFVLRNKEYTATYVRSKVYTDAEPDFLKLGNYDLYVVDGRADFQVFKDTGFVKKVYIHDREVKRSKKIVTDFSEKGLISAAESVLTDLYGSSILEYLSGYYQFDYAKLMEYANSELNRYAVCYRAYLNGVPTDDVVYVSFSLSGALIGVSTPKYLQYKDVNETLLIPLDKLEEAIRSELENLDYSRTYSRIRLRDNELPCYYTMNTMGELYYVTEWEAFKQYTEGAGVTYIETLAIKAERVLNKKSSG